MYSTQVVGIASKPDYFEEGDMVEHYNERVATEIAALTQNWGPRDILSHCDMVLLRKHWLGCVFARLGTSKL